MRKNRHTWVLLKVEQNKKGYKISERMENTSRLTVSIVFNNNKFTVIHIYAPAENEEILKTQSFYNFIRVFTGTYDEL